MFVEGIDSLALKVLQEARKKEHVDVNDSSETLEHLKQLRPELYYDRDKYKAKWSTGDGDYAGVLRGMNRLPVIRGVQVVAR